MQLEAAAITNKSLQVLVCPILAFITFQKYELGVAVELLKNKDHMRYWKQENID